MRIGFVWLLLTIPMLAFSQDAVQLNPSTHGRDSLRDINIKRFPDHFFLYPVIKQRSLTFELEKRSSGDLLTFRPNNSFSFGVGTYLFELGFELVFAIPLNEQSKGIFGESKARDIQLNVLGKTFGVDLFYQKYAGFYITDDGNEPATGMPYPQRSDITSRNYGVTGNYVFNNQKFSFRSVYNFAERQLYSKGSFLLFSGLSSFKLSADSSILTEDDELNFGEDVSFQNLRYTTYSVAPGYTYSLIYKNFFLNGTLAFGPAHHWIHYRLENNIDVYENSINSFVAARIGIGYNGNRLFGGIGFVTQGSQVKFKDVQFSNNNGTFKILIGYRFREFGFLRRRVWELIPFKI